MAAKALAPTESWGQSQQELLESWGGALVLVLNADFIAGRGRMGTDRNRQQGSQGKRCAEKANTNGPIHLSTIPTIVRFDRCGPLQFMQPGGSRATCGEQLGKNRESIIDAVHHPRHRPSSQAIGATLNALIARHARVFDSMREISSIEGDPDLLNHAMALMLCVTGSWVMRFALHWSAASMRVVIATFVDVTQPLDLNVLVAGLFSFDVAVDWLLRRFLPRCSFGESHHTHVRGPAVCGDPPLGGFRARETAGMMRPLAAALCACLCCVLLQPLC